MLDTISMITLLAIMIFFAIIMILIIIGGNIEKTEYERYLEDKEQMEYLKNYKKKTKSNLWRCLWKKKHILGNK